jgi:hypothetical protein
MFADTKYTIYRIEYIYVHISLVFSDFSLEGCYCCICLSDYTAFDVVFVCTDKDAGMPDGIFSNQKSHFG